MPFRGPSVDPNRPVGPQVIGTTVQMPQKWVEIWAAVARNAGVSKSRLVCQALEEFADKHDIELPPYKPA